MISKSTIKNASAEYCLFAFVTEPVCQCWVNGKGVKLFITLDNICQTLISFRCNDYNKLHCSDNEQLPNCVKDCNEIHVVEPSSILRKSLKHDTHLDKSKDWFRIHSKICQLFY